MSLFKRRVPSRQVALRPGTRICPLSIATVLTSSGIPSLDDILGGGLPLSCLLAVLAPDAQSAYGELVQKYFVSQGIACGHKVCIVHEDALSFAKECMWMPASSSNNPLATVDEDEDTVQSQEKVKIAWRYEQMEKFKTTVTPSNLSADHFCDTFDLTSRIPMSVIDDAYSARRFIPLNLTIANDVSSSLDGVTRQIRHVLAATPSTEVVRLCIAALGSPEWGEHGAADILHFLYALRRLLRRHPQACACVSLAPHICTDLWAGSGWVQKVGWVTDATILMSGFGANPGLTALFPSHHGLVQIHKLPTPHSILATSDKYSALRGLSSSAGEGIGTGENNLAFRCMRKRLIFETMHLDLEGGVAERRTRPSSTAISLDAGPVHMGVADEGSTRALATIEVALEESTADTPSHSPEDAVSASGAMALRTRKPKKQVAFHSDKPDLYEF